MNYDTKNNKEKGFVIKVPRWNPLFALKNEELNMTVDEYIEMNPLAEISQKEIDQFNDYCLFCVKCKKWRPKHFINPDGCIYCNRIHYI